ncbi:MAG: bifunctional non-ous end joining protein LigD, partial [Pseudonocardiales bacterium]|nr:bifunctional non-ous end joining protein LigD [Pseudonocardiales bacterium]
PAGDLHFAGRVGSGLTNAVLDRLNSTFAPTDDGRSPFVDAVPDLDGKDATWVRPLVVVEVRHLGWTAGGRLRQPVFRGIRTDLSPQEVRRES